MRSGAVAMLEHGRTARGDLLHVIPQGSQQRLAAAGRQRLPGRRRRRGIHGREGDQPDTVQLRLLDSPPQGGHSTRRTVESHHYLSHHRATPHALAPQPACPGRVQTW
jgi:hypothetical protein